MAIKSRSSLPRSSRSSSAPKSTKSTSPGSGKKIKTSHVYRSTLSSLNCVALFGWFYLLCLVISISTPSKLLELVIPLGLALESICILEGRTRALKNILCFCCWMVGFVSNYLIPRYHANVCFPLRHNKH